MVRGAELPGTMTAPSQGRSRNFFPLLCAIGAFAILSSTMSKNPVLNPFAESLGTPLDFMGVVAAASTLPGVLVSFPAGSLSDVLGKARVLLVSSFVFASAPFLYVLVSSWWHLVLVRFYHGFATAIFVPVARAAIVESYRSRRGERISAFTSSTIIGRSVAPFLGGLILSISVWNYRMIYLAVGAAGVTAFAVTLILLKGGNGAFNEDSVRASPVASREKRPPRSSWGWKEVIQNSGIMVASSVEAATYYCYGALEFFLSGYLKNVAMLDPSLIGVILGMQLALIPVVNPFMGRLSDRVGRKIPIILGLTVSGLVLTLVSFTTQFLPLLLISVTYGLGFSMVTSSTPALVGDLAPKESYGAAMGFLAVLMDIGQMLGPVITGIILSSFGYAESFVSLGAILLGFSVLFGVHQEMAHMKTHMHVQ